MIPNWQIPKVFINGWGGKFKEIDDVYTKGNLITYHFFPDWIFVMDFLLRISNNRKLCFPWFSHVFRQPQSGAAPSSPGSQTGDPKPLATLCPTFLKTGHLEDVIKARPKRPKHIARFPLKKCDVGQSLDCWLIYIFCRSLWMSRWWQLNFLYLHPETWEDFHPILTFAYQHIFQMGWLKLTNQM